MSILDSNLENIADTDLGNDLYEFVSSVKEDLRDYITNGDVIEKKDNFKEGYEQAIGLPITLIDDVEEKMDSDDKQNIYIQIRNSIANAFNQYFGITFDDTSYEVDLNILYITYKFIFLELYKNLFNSYIGYLIINKKIKDFYKEGDEYYHAQKAKELFMNEYEFTSEIMGTYLLITDSGNVDYISMFGEIISIEDEESKELNYSCSGGRLIFDNNFFHTFLSKICENENFIDNMYYLFKTKLNEEKITMYEW